VSNGQPCGATQEGRGLNERWLEDKRPGENCVNVGCRVHKHENATGAVVRNIVEPNTGRRKPNAGEKLRVKLKQVGETGRVVEVTHREMWEAHELGTSHGTIGAGNGSLRKSFVLNIDKLPCKFSFDRNERSIGRNGEGFDFERGIAQRDVRALGTNSRVTRATGEGHAGKRLSRIGRTR
jgi:hypothetical protein